MAVVRYNFRIDDIEKAVLVELEGVTEDSVRKYGVQIRSEVEGLIRERAEVNTPGGLADSVKLSLYQDDDDEFGAIIFSEAEHAMWFEEGTGLFGPRVAWIFPRHKNYMVFFHRKLGRRVYAQKVEGQKARHPFRDGLQRVVGRGGSLRKSGDFF